jgi:hypothetical protein
MAPRFLLSLCNNAYDYCYLRSGVKKFTFDSLQQQQMTPVETKVLARAARLSVELYQVMERQE